MNNIIDVCELSHHFNDKKVLDGIDLQVAQGEIFGLLGPSGAGKTTLIKILTGQLVPSTGKTHVFGKPTSALTGKDYRHLGIMMDSFGLYERLSCFDNLKLFTMLTGQSTECIPAVLEKVGLSTASKTPASNLSKGMRSRLLLARAILTQPKLLFLDEPTSGLDPMTTAEIHKLILEESTKGTTIFLTTHNMSEAEKLCDHIGLLNLGKIVEYGNPQEICRRYNHQKGFVLHLKNGQDLTLPHTDTGIQKLTAYLLENTLETIHSTEPNLETVFMELTGRKFEA